MTADRLLGLLQLADGLFPAGGFAHSLGLETYAQAGRMRDRDDLEALLTAHLEGSAGPADAVVAAAASRGAVADDLAACFALDAVLHATKSVGEFRAASQQMGRQTARVAAAVTGDAFVGALARAVAGGHTPGHHATVFGAVAGRGGADAESVAAALLYSSVALLVGAALRLAPIGQLDGQRALAAMRPRIARLAAEAAAARDAEAVWSFTPGLEIAGWRHARLDMRLFRS